MAFEALKRKLESNGFAVSVFETKQEAADYLDRVIDQTTVSTGGSVSLQELGILPRLAVHNKLYVHGQQPDHSTPEETRLMRLTSEVYLLSANAIAADSGMILSIDGTGNRVASSIYGHQKVYFIAGKNKVSPDFDRALWRLRNVVAPKNAQRLHRKTPCAVKADRCYDCSSPERICNALMVQYKKTYGTNAEIVLINEALGY